MAAILAAVVSAACSGEQPVGPRGGSLALPRAIQAQVMSAEESMDDGSGNVVYKYSRLEAKTALPGTGSLQAVANASTEIQGSGSFAFYVSTELWVRLADESYDVDPSDDCGGMIACVAEAAIQVTCPADQGYRAKSKHDSWSAVAFFPSKTLDEVGKDCAFL